MRGKGKKISKVSGMAGDRHLLPKETIIFEILVRLSAVDVIRCTSVCKEWYALIKSPQFISAHLSLSPSRSQPSVFVNHFSITQQKRVLYSCFDPKSFDNCRTIPFPFPLPWFFCMLGPIHGLFCLFDGARVQESEKPYCLWNPSVRRYIQLPSPPTFPFNVKTMSMIACGFGFDDKTKDYKVVLLVQLFGKGGILEPPNCHLFSLKEGAWRTLGAGEYAKCWIVSKRGTFVGGALHWLADKYGKKDNFSRFILAFDMAHENFKELELPQELLHASREYSILEMKGLLACFDHDNNPHSPGRQAINNCYSIWVMKEYGMANSWVKMWTFQLMGRLSRVYGFWGSGDEILLEKEENFGIKALILYDIKTQRSRDFGGDAQLCISGIHAYTESLILFDKESRADSYKEPTSDADISQKSTKMKRKTKRIEGR